MAKGAFPSLTSAVLALGLAVDLVVGTTSFEDRCTKSCFGDQVARQYPNSTVNIVQYVPAGTNITFPYNAPSCARPGQVVAVDLCRVAMNINTSSSSQITLETWLPRNWTGRFLSTGNGGLSGCIQYEDIAYGAAYGFATVGANNGHNGTSGAPFYQAPGVVEDFAYRSVHTGVVVGKHLTNEFYGKKYNHSYYLGCSTGGREGFKEIQDFPNDFDGVVAGAPAFDFNHLIAWSFNFFAILGPNTSSTYVPSALWTVIHNEILNQCDGLDGVVDGIIEDPELCYWRPEALICAANTTTNCLTAAQAGAVRQVYEPVYGINGTLLYPRMQPGSELAAVNFLYNGSPFSYSVDWYKYAVPNNINFTNANFTRSFLAYVDSLDSTALYNISTWKGDLSAFRKKGGKVLTYHGQQDFLITSANSPRYYNHVSRTMNLTSHAMDDFYRFFRISGMGHCSGGPGAWNIGQTTRGFSYADVEDNVLLRMVAWVERGAAPEYVTGTKFVNDTASLGVAFKRKHCKYPARNTYVGPGNYTDPEAWKCIGDSF